MIEPFQSHDLDLAAAFFDCSLDRTEIEVRRDLSVQRSIDRQDGDLDLSPRLCRIEPDEGRHPGRLHLVDTGRLQGQPRVLVDLQSLDLHLSPLKLAERIRGCFGGRFRIPDQIEEGLLSLGDEGDRCVGHSLCAIKTRELIPQYDASIDSRSCNRDQE